MFRLIGVVVLAVWLSGCGASTPTLDTSSDKSFKESMERMTAGMSADEKDEFGKDCFAAIFEDATKAAFDKIKSGEKADPDFLNESRSNTFTTINGLNVAQIREKSAQAKARIRQREEEEKAADAAKAKAAS